MRVTDDEKRYAAFQVLRRNTVVAIWLYTGLCNIIFVCIFAGAFTGGSAAITPLSEWIMIAITIPTTFLLFSTPLIAHLKLNRKRRSGLIFAGIGSFLFIISPFFIGFFTGTIPTLRSVLFVRRLSTDQWLYAPEELTQFVEETDLE